MAFNGSGTFLINTAGQPVVSGTVISSTAFNALTADLATGLSTAITKDGQTTVTANIPMSTYKFTGLGVGSAATDSANLSQVQSTVTKLLTSVSGTDTITAVGAPVVAAYAAGQMFYFVATGDNTGAVTLNIDSLGAKAVTRDGSVALAAGDIKSGEVVVVVYDGTRFQVVSQLNSAGNATFANVSITSALNVGGVATFSAGTAAAPSITTTGDTNTGIFFPAADTIAFTEGGVEAARFDSSGNLGIGTSSPSDILTLAGGASGSYGLTINNAKVGGGTKAIFQYDATNAIALLGGVTTNGLAFQTLTGGSLTTKATIDSSGNLGIGTSSPGAKLEASSTTDGDTVRVSFPSAATGTTGGGIQFRAYTNSAVLVEQSRIQNICTDGSASYGAALRFMTAGSGSLSERMRLDSSGNLGIGTTTIGSRVTIGDPGTGLSFTNATATSGFNIGLLAGTGSAQAYVFSRDNAALLFGTNNTERARITSGGYSKFSNSGTYSNAALYHEFYQTNNNTALLVRATNATFSDAVVTIQGDRTTTNTSYYLLDSYNGNLSGRFRIADSGNATNTNGSYGTISDAKMKTDIVDAGSQWDDLKAVRFRKFKMKDDPQQITLLGVVAQELEQTSPGLVEEHADRDTEGNDLGTTTKSVKSSILLMKAAVALQEAMARIEQLEAKFAALESK